MHAALVGGASLIMLITGRLAGRLMNPGVEGK